jgi:hypothetical protein
LTVEKQPPTIFFSVGIDDGRWRKDSKSGVEKRGVNRHLFSNSRLSRRVWVWGDVLYGVDLQHLLTSVTDRSRVSVPSARLIRADPAPTICNFVSTACAAVS